MQKLTWLLHFKSNQMSTFLMMLKIRVPVFIAITKVFTFCWQDLLFLYEKRQKKIYSTKNGELGISKMAVSCPEDINKSVAIVKSLVTRPFI